MNLLFVKINNEAVCMMQYGTFKEKYKLGKHSAPSFKLNDNGECVVGFMYNNDQIQAISLPSLHRDRLEIENISSYIEAINCIQITHVYDESNVTDKRKLARLQYKKYANL